MPSDDVERLARLLREEADRHMDEGEAIATARLLLNGEAPWKAHERRALARLRQERGERTDAE